MKQPKYSRSADFDQVDLFKREDEIYSDIRKARRTHIALLLVFFIILFITAYAILIKDYKDPIPPITVTEQEQMVELQSYHSDKGLVKVDDGLIIVMFN